MSTEEFSPLSGKEFPPSVYEIEYAHISRFCRVIQDFNPLWQEFAPAAFLITIPNEEVIKEIFRQDLPEQGVLNGGNELEIYQPIKIGDKLSVHARLKEVRQLKERLFLFFEFSYINQAGELIARGKNTIVRYKLASPLYPEPIYRPPPPFKLSKPPQIRPLKNSPKGTELEVGQAVPPLIKCPDLEQLIGWAHVCRDYYRVHYDREFARRLGFPEVIVHGSLIFAFLGQMLTDWLACGGELIKLAVNYRGVHFAHQEILCRGKITKLLSNKEGKPLVELMVWTESEGERKAQGSALVSLKD